jgi:hypothetical protein
VPARGSGQEVAIIGGVQLRTRTMGIRPPWIIRDGRYRPVQPAWLYDVKLVLIGWEETARFNREVEVEEFQLRP